MSAAAPRLAIGVDLGGTNLRAALVDVRAQAGAAPALVGETRVALGGRTDPEHVAERLAEIVASAAAAGGRDAERAPVGVGVAGMLRGATGVVANAPNLAWRDVPLRELLAARLGGRLVELYNDVNAIAFGEYTFGAGRGPGVADVLAVFVGTGIGGGLVCGGRLVEGASNVAGEIGHVKVVTGPDARPCGCGARGCVEAYVGGLNLERRVHAELRQRRSLAVELAGGDPGSVHPGFVDEAARRGDAYAVELWDEIAPLLGLVLANAVTLVNPARLVLGGGVLRGAPELRRRVVAAYEAAVNAPSREACELVASALGDSAGILGSAALAALARD